MMSRPPPAVFVGIRQHLFDRCRSLGPALQIENRNRLRCYVPVLRGGIGVVLTSNGYVLQCARVLI